MNRILATRVTLLLAAALALTASATSENRLRTIGPGGGGALFHPTISPHDPRTVLVACDMTGSYITTDAGDHWHVFNLGLQVQCFLFDPIDPRVIYAKSGALFRTTDGGMTWAQFFPSTVTKITMGDDHAAPTLHVASGPRGEIGAMAIDPGDFRVLYLAIESALWTSIDGGAAWQKSAALPSRRDRYGSTRARARPTAPSTWPIPCIVDRPVSGAAGRPPASSRTSRGLPHASMRPRPARSSYPLMAE
jgi:hypothetical protein